MSEKDEKYYTLKMLSDELGISKPAVRKRINGLAPTLVSTATDGKTILITSEGAEILRNQQAEKVPTKVPTEVPTDTKVGTNHNDELVVRLYEERIADLKGEIETLKEQLSIKDEQIKTQQKQIESWESSYNTMKLVSSSQPLMIESADATKEETKWSRFISIFKK